MIGGRNTPAAATSDPLADLRFRRNIERLHALRPLYKLLSELGRGRMIRGQIEQIVKRYAGLDPEALRITGGDRFATRPLHLIG